MPEIAEFHAVPAALGFLSLLATAMAVGCFALGRRRESHHRRDLQALRAEVWALKEAASARDRAEAASEAKSRFLANVSHEFRTPLNGILGMAELLNGTSLDAEQKAYIEAICSSGGALASLIDEILDFSKIEAGKFDITEAPFDLAGLVESVVELLAPRAQGKGLEIASMVAADVPKRLIGDEQRLRQVLLNLAGNAVKFTDDGGVGLRVTRDQGDLLRFAVIDTGPGVPADRQAVIFKEFEQADGSATRRHGGTGLGLAISQKLVERMGGTLTLDRTSAAGSTFSISLALPAATSAADGAAGQRLAGRTALIVATSIFEAPYLGERLTEAGLHVRHVMDADAAAAVLAKRGTEAVAPDIVIVDCALGEEALRRLGGVIRTAGVRRSLVLFSPFERRAFARNPLSGFDGWLVKPVRSRSLLARLAAKPQVRSAETSAVPHAPHFLGFEILVAEDNDINALIATRHLERLGARVTRASDGTAAVEIASQAIAGRRQPFDVIFLDIRMPGFDGFEAARRIRLAEMNANCPPSRLVALTADAFEADRKAAEAAGIDDYLTKPVDFDHFDRALQACKPRSLDEAQFGFAEA